MNTNHEIQLHKAYSLPQLTEDFRTQIVEGHINPLQAYTQLSLLKNAAEAAMKDQAVLDAAMNEYSKHGEKLVTMGDCKIEQIEAGTKYDYSTCEDSTLDDMVERYEALGAEIKVRQDMLKHLPESGMADPETGNILYRPAKTSKTTLKITFKK